MMGSTWRAAVGDDEGRSLSFVVRRPWPDLTPVDLSAIQSLLITVTRLSDKAETQQDLATVTDGPNGRGEWTLAELPAVVPGYSRVDARVTWPDTSVATYLVGHLLVIGPRPLTGATVPPLDPAGDSFVVQVVQWTPAGDQVIELHVIGPDLLPTGTPTYLWDDPADSTNALVPWPGDPNTLLDEKP